MCDVSFIVGITFVFSDVFVPLTQSTPIVDGKEGGEKSVEKNSGIGSAVGDGEIAGPSNQEWRKGGYVWNFLVKLGYEFHLKFLHVESLIYNCLFSTIKR